ncbi:MAG: sigma-54-dependent Fis family transcriptional regulator [Sedimentisphaerales bacterium]|nr:sigma-54-dependent Fis family transcriptional regulator [Sedimentisphaerales bacterium]
MAKILVVDDKEMMRDSLQATLTKAQHSVVASESAVAALELLKKSPFDAIITDLKMPRMDGLAFLDALGKMDTEVPVVMMTAYASIPTAVEAMRKGAFDYIQKPFNAEEVTLLIERAIEHHRLVKENEAYQVNARDWQRGRQLIGNSGAMKKVMEKIKLLAPTSATILIRGESGTGKELVARAIHAHSPRANKPLLCVNCAALSSSLLESELFGHEKGAFTGADNTRKGRFELADGGTILLDEISEMDLQLQAKLLRVLQEREFERVGSSITRQVDVRVLATTNRDLALWCREERFREDLYYRLNVVPIELPSLRERVDDDLESLCEYFLRRIADREGAELTVLDSAIIERLKKYHWPGNVRELENLMERVAILGTSEIHPSLLLNDTHSRQVSGSAEQEDEASDINAIEECKTLADMERVMIEQTLEKYDGHRQKTAHALGIGVRTLGLKLKRWKAQESSALGR